MDISNEIQIFLFNHINNITIPEVIFICITLFILSLCLITITFNLVEWITQVYKYSKMGWFQYKYPNLDDRIIKMKYTIYIVDNITGEIFYIDKKMLNKLKRKDLIRWDYDINFYVFHNNDINEVRNIVTPLIKLYPINEF